MSYSLSKEEESYLPNLPGFRPRTLHSLSNTHKTAYLQIVDGKNRFVVDKQDQGLPKLNSQRLLPIDQQSLSTSLAPTTNSLIPRSKNQPALENVSVILSFTAFFEEEIAYIESHGNNGRIRHCNIHYFLENGTISIVEKQQPNSGIPQGTIVRRSVIYREDDQPMTPRELAPGETVLIFNRPYCIIDCDDFTRKYFSRVYNLHDLPKFHAPKDKYDSYRESLENGPSEDWNKYRSKKNESKSFTEARLGHACDNTTRQGFSIYGSKKLNFKCVWDDSQSLYGDFHEYSLFYHLCDDTVEINSLSNSHQMYKSSDQPSRLLKRCKLPKDSTISAANNIGNTQLRDYYTWADFQIGTEINVYSRVLRVVSADRFTKEFYRAHNIILNELNDDEVSLMSSQSHMTQQHSSTIVPPREIPPPTGFGSEEDSLRSCLGSLNISPPKPKKLGENKIITFSATIQTQNNDDIYRKFVVMYYLVDGTLKILEPPQRNSGFVGGTFLSRREVKLPNGEKLNEGHMFMGTKIEILNTTFLLHETSDSTLFWMEEHKLPKSNIFTILSKLQSNLSILENTFIDDLKKQLQGLSSVTMDALVKIFESYGMVGDDENIQFVSHEIKTILRYFTNVKSKQFDIEKFIQFILNPNQVELY